MISGPGISRATAHSAGLRFKSMQSPTLIQQRPFRAERPKATNWHAPLPSALAKQDFFALDLEFIAKKGKKHADIIEIAVVHFKNGKVVNHTETLVRHHGSLPGGFIRLTGISPETLETAPSLSQALEQVCEFIRQSLPQGQKPVLVGHNVMFMDIPAMIAALRETGQREYLPLFESGNVICTQTLAKNVLGTGDRRGLANLTRDLQLPQEPAHQDHVAYFDALQTGRLLYEIIRRSSFAHDAFRIENLDTLVRLGRP